MAKRAKLKTQVEAILSASSPTRGVAITLRGGSHADARGKRGRGDGKRGSRKGQRGGQDRRAVADAS